MTKEFITYEQAMALKELDFDEPCFYHYEYHSERLCEDKAFLIAGNGNKYYKDTNMEKSVNAPLYQQAFRWFREKHNLVFNFISYNIVKPGEYHWSITWNDEAKASGIVKTYEEAELECLNTLIQIVKSK